MATLIPDEQEQAAYRADHFLGQHPPDLMSTVAKPLQRLKLAVVVVGHNPSKNVPMVAGRGTPPPLAVTT